MARLNKLLKRPRTGSPIIEIGEKRIRGGETQYAIPFEHLTEPIQQIVLNAKRLRKLKMEGAGIATGAAVLTMLTPKELAALAKFVGIPAMGVSAVLTTGARWAQNHEENTLAALVFAGLPLIKAEHADQHRVAANSKWKSMVIPIKGNDLKLSTQAVPPKQLVSRGTDPFWLKTCNRIAFRPKSFFGTDEYAWWFLEQIGSKLTAQRNKTKNAR